MDLRALNRFVKIQQFKMVTLAAIIPSLNQRDWFSALELQDAYFHFTIHPSHRRFLRFTLGQDYFQYKVFPFGLSSAPRVSSKVLSVVAASLHKQDIIFPYLDDFLFKTHSSCSYIV